MAKSCRLRTTSTLTTRKQKGVPNTQKLKSQNSHNNQCQCHREHVSVNVMSFSLSTTNYDFDKPQLWFAAAAGVIWKHEQSHHVPSLCPSGNIQDNLSSMASRFSSSALAAFSSCSRFSRLFKQNECQCLCHPCLHNCLLRYEVFFWVVFPIAVRFSLFLSELVNWSALDTWQALTNSSWSHPSATSVAIRLPVQRHWSLQPDHLHLPVMLQGMHIRFKSCLLCQVVLHPAWVENCDIFAFLQKHLQQCKQKCSELSRTCVDRLELQPLSQVMT